MIRSASLKAFTLVEIMFSIFILAVAVTTVMGLLAAGARRQGLERDRELANQLAVAVGEAAYFSVGATTEMMQRALDSGSAFAELPTHISGRIRSADGSLERAIGLGAKIVYLDTHDGQPIDPLQLRIIAAFVTPEGGDVVPAGANWSPSLACRALVCWSADWTRLYECEDDGSGGHVDRNRNGARDYGPLAPGGEVDAVEVGRFNVYDPHVALTLRGLP